MERLASERIGRLLVGEPNGTGVVVSGLSVPHTRRATGQLSFFGLLCSTLDALGLAGQCTGIGKRRTSTIKMSFALAEDASRFSELVNAAPGDAVERCASVSTFVYDKALYDRLKAARDARRQALREAVAHTHPVLTVEIIHFPWSATPVALGLMSATGVVHQRPRWP